MRPLFATLLQFFLNKNNLFCRDNSVTGSAVSNTPPISNVRSFNVSLSMSKPSSMDDDNSDYSLDEDDDRDDDDSLPTQVSGFTSSDKNGADVVSTSINLEDQESMKKERKRQRNRIAATKCRQKKIAKINAFEEQIKELKRKHEELLQEKASLKEKTSLLKENVLFHVKKGCNVIVAPLALTE